MYIQKATSCKKSTRQTKDYRKRKEKEKYTDYCQLQLLPTT